jgi:hypothetical protein
MPANGGVQPPRAPPTTFKKRTISRAKRSAATTCSVLRHPWFAYRWHVPPTPWWDHALHDGRSVRTTHIWNQAAQNEQSAQRAFVPHAAQRAWARRETSTTGVPQVRFAPLASQKECHPRSPDTERIAHQPPPRRAAHDDFKIAPISRAEGGRLHARVGRTRVVAVEQISTVSHPPTTLQCLATEYGDRFSTADYPHLHMLPLTTTTQLGSHSGVVGPDLVRPRLPE